MKPDAQAWLAQKAAGFLRRIGVSPAQTVLDFGCNTGNYTRAAAGIVGRAGRVVALDKDKESLEGLNKEAKKKGWKNVECLSVSADGAIPLAPGSVDVVLLYDVLHRGYFPEQPQRERALARIHRVLKPGGMLSFYPTHLRKYAMTFRRQLGEVARAGFVLDDESRRTLVHDGRLVRGRVFGFRKRARARQQAATE
ncbi:MAG: class I SAM-dependent methyltransferase [Planctomycetota bacterium]